MCEHALTGVRVVELADERAEYCGLLLAGLGADVVKVEPPGGSPTRRIGPFHGGVEDPERSLFFWHYNRAKRSVVLDLDDPQAGTELDNLLACADVLLTTTPAERLAAVGLAPAELARRLPALVIARLSPFGDTGPWAAYKASDLVHLALGGVMANCGYSPRPDGTYELPPIAPQVWHAYHIAGEQLAMAVVAALVHREQTGRGQVLSCAVHQAVSCNTELDVMSWIMRRAPLHRQTCTHAAEEISPGTPLAMTKDGRWVSTSLLGARDRTRLLAFLAGYGVDVEADACRPGVEEAGDVPARLVPGSSARNSEEMIRAHELAQRVFRRFRFADAPWHEAQAAGVICAPVRRPEENLGDPHWRARGTFAEVDHPELGRAFTYPVSKWVSSATPWRIGRRAPRLGEDGDAVRAELAAEPRRAPAARRTWWGGRLSRLGKPMALDGIRVLDFTWFLASAGATRFLAALGAECIKVEWRENPDTRLGAMAPIGGRVARERATGPLPGVDDPDMGGQFNNKNAGKRGISLNVRHPDGLALARRLVALSDVVAEGFSAGVMDRWGLGYDALRAIKPDIIYAQQSGMGQHGTYAGYRAVGPVAAALAGTSEMSGLPEPAPPAGWGYSYLDWIGAYSFATAILAALYHRDRTGQGQWIDASQVEAGLFVSGTAPLEWSADGRCWRRTGNRSRGRLAAPHGAYPTEGVDRWLAITCFTEAEWSALCAVARQPAWREDHRFASLSARVAHQDALDAVVAAWTCTQDGYDAMHSLQAAGVPAGVCQTAEDRVDHDPQLRALGWLTEITGTRIGTWPVPEVPVKLSATPAFIGGAIDRGAPCYGEDRDYVLGDLLGLSSREIERLAAENVI